MIRFTKPSPNGRLVSLSTTLLISQGNLVDLARLTKCSTPKSISSKNKAINDIHTINLHIKIPVGGELTVTFTNILTQPIQIKTFDSVVYKNSMLPLISMVMLATCKFMKGSLICQFQ